MSDFIYNGGVITMGKMYKIRQVFKFPVCANECVLFSLEILPQACEKHI